MVEGVEIITSSIPPELLTNLNTLITLFQIFGGFVLVYLIIGIITILINKKKLKELRNINKNVEEIKGLLRKKSN